LGNESFAGEATVKLLLPLRYAFPCDAITIEDLDKASPSTLLLAGESS
jgi:hypothetical protein